MSATRRQFLASALAAGAGLALGGPAAAIDPIRRTGKPHLRLSLAAYSYRKYLDLKKPTMTLDDAHRLGGKVKGAIRAAVPRVQYVLVHMEPFAGATIPTGSPPS